MKTSFSLLILLPTLLIASEKNSSYSIMSDSGKTEETVYNYVNEEWVPYSRVRYQPNYGSPLKKFIEYYHPTEGFKVTRVCLYNYNYDGKTVRQYSEGFYEGAQYIKYFDIIYGYYGLLVSNATRYVYGSGTPYEFRDNYSYTSFDSISEVRNYTVRDAMGSYDGGKLQFKNLIYFDGNSRKRIASANYFEDIYVRDSTIYIYNSIGKVQEEITEKVNSTPKKTKIVYSYNDKELLSEQQGFYWSDTTNLWEPDKNGIFNFYYDENGRLIETINSILKKKIVTKENDKLQVAVTLTPRTKTVVIYSTPSSVEDHFSQDTKLSFYPNPLKENSSISYTLPKEGYSKVTLHDIFGREVATIHNGFKSAGNYTIPFKNENLPNGIYFLKMNTGGQTVTKSISISR